MPYNGSGVFQRVMSWAADSAAGIKIKSDRHDAEDDNFAQGLSNAITKDGQQTILADIPWNGRKITGLADPTAPQHAATKKYVDDRTNYSTPLVLAGSGDQGRITFSGGEIASPAANFGALGLTFPESDLFFGVRKIDTTPDPDIPARFVVNDKADGTGLDLFTVRDDGISIHKGPAAALRIVPTTGDGKIVIRSAADDADRMAIVTSGGAQGNVIITIGAQTYTLGGTLHRLTFGSGTYLDTVGNIYGSIWSNLGYPDAYTAVVNRIESRAQVWANDRVAALQYRKVSLGFNGTSGGFSNLGGGTVIVGYAREGGGTGQVSGLYYMTLQVYDPVRGWVSFSG